MKLRNTLAVLIFIIQTCAFAQTDAAYSFIVAGHAYGAHAGTNIGLHPNLLNSLSGGFDQKAAFIVLTGDIVNTSTTESWAQVDTELAGLGLESYYVMGNHDNNSIGHDVFAAKHGGDYYAFSSQSELFIVLNSTESDRSISSAQLTFMEEKIAQADNSIQNIFIFYHEVIWNSKEKYTDVRSNSRSRYASIFDQSNYWDEVHPICTAQPEKNFYMISGDVGGNPDAIAAFYDTCDNVTLLSSGMGEVDDENYLLVKVINKDSIVLELVALSSEIVMDPIKYYSVPQQPDSIVYTLPLLVGMETADFTVAEVPNADSYIWDLPSKVSGVSVTNTITLDFEEDFLAGELSVQAARDGFGISPARTASLEMIIIGTETNNFSGGNMQLQVRHTSGEILLSVTNIEDNELQLCLFDMSGKLILNRSIGVTGSEAEVLLQQCEIPQGIHLLYLSSKKQNIAKKIIVN